MVWRTDSPANVSGNRSIGDFTWEVYQSMIVCSSIVDLSSSVISRCRNTDSTQPGCHYLVAAIDQHPTAHGLIGIRNNSGLVWLFRSPAFYWRWSSLCRRFSLAGRARFPHSLFTSFDADTRRDIGGVRSPASMKARARGLGVRLESDGTEWQMVKETWKPEKGEKDRFCHR